MSRSRATAPRTVMNEMAFCAPNYGQGDTVKYRKKKTTGLRRQKNEKPEPRGRHDPVLVEDVSNRLAAGAIDPQLAHLANYSCTLIP